MEGSFQGRVDVQYHVQPPPSTVGDWLNERLGWVLEVRLKRVGKLEMRDGGVMVAVKKWVGSSRLMTKRGKTIMLGFH